MTTQPFYKTPYGGAILSVVVPGLGLILRGYPTRAIPTLLLGASLCMMTWAVWQWAGVGAGVFLCMLILLPWWAFQTYQASLLSPPGMVGTWKKIWASGHDIRYLGALFFIAAFTDLYIILANPTYSLHVFCTRPTGVLGALAKAQSPTFHVAIGYGFLRQRRWSLLVYLVYASYGLINATVNYACEGYGRIRTVFFITLLVFTAYVLLRRECFHPSPKTR